MSILGEQTKLRPIERSDLPKIQTWRNSQSLTKYFREYRLFSLDQKESWYDSMIKDNRFEFFIIEAEGKRLGIAGLTYIDWVSRHADVHFYIGDKNLWIDNAFSPEAFNLILNYGFDKLNLHRIYALIMEKNVASIKCAEAAGFKCEGKIRDYFYKNGIYEKVLYYNIIN